jgi:tetratricopeptide (TPR) repeat protein
LDLGDAVKRVVIAVFLLVGAVSCGVWAQAPLPKEIVQAKQAMAAKKFVEARSMFEGYLKAHPGSVDAMVGVAEADLALHRYETAESEFRKVTAVQPENWNAHKNLVIIEAALGRWEEFDRERALLQAARERDAPGISARESDVIDAFDVNGKHWIVRAYYVPVGRSETIYNFEQFSPDGRVAEYVSLESAEAAKAAAANVGGEVSIGGESTKRAASGSTFALNWYNGHAHGTIKHYAVEEPSYEKVRSDVMRWLKSAR